MYLYNSGSYSNGIVFYSIWFGKRYGIKFLVYAIITGLYALVSGLQIALRLFPGYDEPRHHAIAFHAFGLVIDFEVFVIE